MKWNSVDEFQPEKPQLLLVKSPTGTELAEYKYFSEQDIGYFVVDGAYIQGVTHWMPLPTPLKGNCKFIVVSFEDDYIMIEDNKVSIKMGATIDSIKLSLERVARIRTIVEESELDKDYNE